MSGSHGEPQEGLPILRREDTSPEAFRAAVWGRVFNSIRDDRSPRAVVATTEPGHVTAAVRLAAKEGCRVSVRSGGHSWAAWSVREDAILVDLHGLRELAFDEKTATVRCSPAFTGRELNDYLAGRGRMFAGGHCPDVGLGGFLLQGGMGWNCKNWGWACESVVGVDVVTADGRELHCSETEHEDLFWAARGSGPGFPAIVTRFHLITRPETLLMESLYFYPLSAFRTVLQWVIDVSPTADPDTEIVCVSGYFPGSDDIQILAHFTTFKPTAEEAAAALLPLHAGRPSGAAAEVAFSETNLAQQYAVQCAANPLNHRYASDNAYVRNSVPSVPAVLERAFTTLPSRKSAALYFAMNPCSRRPPVIPPAALSMQSDHYFAVYAVWEEESDDARCEGWVRDVFQACERESVGSYLGDADFRRREARYWGQEEEDRLKEVRKAWDPEGRIAGFLDRSDGRNGGLRNRFEWE